MQTIQKTKPSKVYFLPLLSREGQDNIFASAENVLNHRAFQLLRIFHTRETVGIKVSRDSIDGTAATACAVAEMLQKRGASPFVCDTSNRHFSLGDNAVQSIGALTQGLFGSGMGRYPVIMLDGMNGEHEVCCRVKGRTEKEAHIAGELPNVGGMVIISRIELHRLCGVSGAMFNTGTGLASKRGKIRQYSSSIPRVNIDKCYACRRCLHECPANAIYMAERHVEINPDRCINCGRCVETARFGGIAYRWDATPHHFTNVMVQHAAAAVEIMNRRMVFINILDASGAGSIEGAGLLFSRDPVAIDAAAIEMLKNNRGLDSQTLGIAVELLEKSETAGIGQRSCKLETIAY